MGVDFAPPGKNHPETANRVDDGDAGPERRIWMEIVNT
jgi:hypothetical protein